MSPSPVPNPERDQEIAMLRREGLASLAEISKRFGISRERVRQISAAYGVDNPTAARAYAEHRAEQKMNGAEQFSDVILMRYIDGEEIPEIAHSLSVGVASAQAVLDEKVTDAVIAARNNNRLARVYPNSDPGPREKHEPRVDRHWTEDRVFDILVRLARKLNGLPTSSRYMEMSAGNEELPSFATVRNRLGRWSSVRARVHAKIWSQ